MSALLGFSRQVWGWQFGEVLPQEYVAAGPRSPSVSTQPSSGCSWTHMGLTLPSREMDGLQSPQGVQHLPRGPMPWPSGALPVLCWGGRHSHTFTCLIHQKEARQHVLPSFLSQESGVPKRRVWHKEGSCPQPSPTEPAPIISAQPTWPLPLCFQPIHTMALSRPVALRTICILMAAH